ncbi:MAG: glycoside hydrolase family 97 catalytic domain-containing protein, partial [Rhodopirellula sp. JB044]|uniref:glycoside hydrolase family 97 protein n=1 Tax=Rhodopirellula sp. JB044 TaxID=3342844 RepID=UPI00370ADF93
MTILVASPLRERIIMIRDILFATLISFVIQTADASTSTAESMSSPDGQVVATLFANEEGDLRYQVEWKGRVVIEPSALGISVDGQLLGSNVEIGEPAVSATDETYATRGVHSIARNHYKRWVFPITHQPSGREYTLEARVYDDGVAIRYVVPGKGRQHVDGESSSWKVIPDSKAWYFERLTKGWKLKSYAGEWLATDIDNLANASPVGPVQGTPVVLELPFNLGFAAITKAATYSYSGMRLKAIGQRTLVADFTEGNSGFDVEGTIVTPWRVTMLADDLDELVGSDLIKNLNPRPDEELFADTSYIRPGRTVWSWETLGLGTPETQREFIDLAAEMGFEYTTIDDGWKDWNRPWETVVELVEHAASKDVGVWLWVHSQDIRSPENGYQQMRDYFRRVSQTGAVGLKIDFMNGESKELVDFEIAVLRNAAKAKLMINFHGCHASTGEERTYPNEMTREGIRGIEVNKMREGPIPAFHNAALPFTRFIVGHADYTPALFSNPGPTTWAHQVATLVLFTSGLQTYAEHPGTMMNARNLQEASHILQNIPSVWDETIVLEGSKIGSLAGMARRKGEQWFVGVVNGEQKARDFETSLTFLGNGECSVEIIRDDIDGDPIDLVGMNAKAKLHGFNATTGLVVEKHLLRRSETLNARLA